MLKRTTSRVSIIVPHVAAMDVGATDVDMHDTAVELPSTDDLMAL